MIVLSLFDGISCGRIALERAGIKVDKYYASEIDKRCINVTMKHYPDTIQLGDVSKWREWKIPWHEIDLLIGGFCCQSFSAAGHSRGFNDPRGKLFFCYADILNHLMRATMQKVNFLAENVVMKEEYRTMIDGALMRKPVMIDSSLVSAQQRKRLYWVSWDFEPPKDKGIYLKDVIDDGEFIYPSAIRGRYLNGNSKATQILEVSKNTGKSNCLITVSDNCLLSKHPPGSYSVAYIDYLKDRDWRHLTNREMCRLQTLPDDYMDGMAFSACYNLVGNAWTVDVITHILKQLNNG